MRTPEEQARVERVVKAFAAAVLVAGATPPLAMMLYGLGGAPLRPDYLPVLLVAFLFMAMFGWFVALLHMVIAFPLYEALRKRGAVNWFTSAALGAAVGAVPLPLLFGREGSWNVIGACAGAGLVGGLVFRAVLGRQA